MQKFVVKKISRSTNILLTSECEQSLSSNSNCGNGENSQKHNINGHQMEVSSVKMCGYLKKKRNVRKFKDFFLFLKVSIIDVSNWVLKKSKVYN
jgi:hypothetical protein